MKALSFLLLAALVATAARGQSSRIPWSGVASGTGASSGSSLNLRSAAGQALVGKTSGFFSNPAAAGSGGLFVAIAGGWNLVSVPLAVSNYTKTVLFPTSTSSAFSYQGSYIAQAVLANGPGYWLKFASAQNTPFTGTVIPGDSIPVTVGWNLIGSISNPVAVSSISSLPPGIIASSYYAYQGGYAPALTIEPGRGYWVKTSQAGQLVLASPPSPNLPPQAAGVEPAGSLARLILRDAAGNEQTLYFGATGTIDPSRYELPPLPPDGVFDIRFTSGSMAAVMDQGIRISGAIYPVQIRTEGGGTAALVVDGRETPLSSTGATVIRNPKSSVALKLGGLIAVPAEFALMQNYPNPFNPTTDIRLQITDFGRVRLVVYDLLGRQVAMLVDEYRAPGSYTVSFDGTNLASGVYIYRITAGQFTATKRMTLVK
jgi:hypothetical protein